MSLLQLLDYYWDFLLTWAMHAGMPIVHVYHLITSSVFLNVAAEDASFLENAANVALAPTHYLLSGRIARVDPSTEWSLENEKTHVYRLEQRFNYDTPFMWIKTAASVAAFPVSITVGSVLKGLSYFSEDTRKRHGALSCSMKSPWVVSHLKEYEKMGLQWVPFDQSEWTTPPEHVRRPGDEKNMGAEKEALRDVVGLLVKSDIPFWLDCGTCLGAHRYGGIIPWDFDIDIAVLQLDFDNVYKVLQQLDPEKYVVQDWSGRDRPKSYLKVYVKETGSLIDIYHFAIHPETKTIASVLSNENSIFLSNGWKTRERRFIIETPYDWVFPLKKANFDGIVAFVPNQVEKYLKQRYGEDIGPAKVFNAVTDRYEKDDNHPYWKQPFAH